MQLPPEPQPSTSLDEMPPVTEQPRTSNKQTSPQNSTILVFVRQGGVSSWDFCVW